MDSETAKQLLVSFSGEIIETIVADRPSVADDWVKNILLGRHNHHKASIIVGFDCKFTTSHPIRSMNEKIATLQLCVDMKCLVLPLSHLEFTIPESVKRFLEDPNASLYGVEVQDCMSKLQRGYGFNSCYSKIVDIRALVKLIFPRREEPTSLKAMAYKVAGLSLRRRKKRCDQLDNWESRVLDEEMVEHACVDAYACYKIAHKLLN